MACRRRRVRCWIGRNDHRSQPLFRAGQPADRNGPGGPGGLHRWRSMCDGKLGPDGSYAVEGIGQSAVPPVADLSRVSRPTRSPMRAVSKSPVLCCAQAVFSPAPPAERCVAAALEYCREQTVPKKVSHLHLRQREQVSVEDVQRLLDARSGLHPVSENGRSSRSYPPPLSRRAV